ncbi:MAG: pyruvate kinase [Planctomycetota bacterium]|jgi:pyruvate kinase
MTTPSPGTATPADPSADPHAASPPTLTRIIATVGPATRAGAVLERLIRAGVDIFRLNFSHGDLDEHGRYVDSIRGAAEATGMPVAILGDLQGPRIRLGPVADGPIDVPTGSHVTIQREPVTASAHDRPLRFSCTYRRLVEDVEPGQRLLIGDGRVRMLVFDKRPEEFECTVTHGGLVDTGRGINLPETDLSVAPLSDRDWACVRWAIDREIDFLAQSFVRAPGEVERLVEGIAEIARQASRPGWTLPVIAKIEHPKAVERIDEIVAAADGIMVARGDLGVEMELARVPVIQRQLVAATRAWGKPCIVATQMLETMIDSPSPTRAEVSDVAGAIFDGVDAVMLSGETAIGRYPLLAVEHMQQVARHTETSLASMPAVEAPPARLVAARDWTAAVAHGVWTIAQDAEARLVVVWSQSGAAARALSQNAFQVPIVAFTSDLRAARRMQILRGVQPLHTTAPSDLGGFTTMADELLVERGWARPGDVCILVAGAPIGASGVTDSLAIHRIGHPGTGFRRSGGSTSR